ncbi:protein FAR-RED IMPAIRED RESPONSE 1-like [Curcuma longa]|uniref:protein FAR-RED IMPAIRED RESPONSE 1-like n=1 Tax=Curcuma longa TaxID=136217 RepID=UPI003D9DFA5B
MPTGAPKVIITDQDPAMTKAIAQVFPQTFHRYCLWHILNKFSEKLNPLTFRDNYQSIKNVISNSTTPDEFENSWEEIIKCANLEKNDWLCLMYALRQKWVPAYFSNVFCAGMSSSQRSESSHAFFKKYISKKNSLMDFITLFNRALRHQRHNELIADHIDMNEHPKTKTIWPMETQMVKLYTKNKWMEFQSQMSESHGYYVKQISVEVDHVVYHVMNFQSCSSSKPRVLTHDNHSDYISCSCKKFEFDGIPCRHMLAFFQITQVFHLPDKYILKRWTQHAKVGAIYDLGEQNFIDDPERFLMSRHSKLSYKASVLIDDASLTDEGTKFLDEQFDCIYKKIQEMNIGKNCDYGSQRNKSMDEPPVVSDPSLVRTKRCGKRLKSSKEKAVAKSRLCHGCGNRGVSHDKRNCPLLQQGSSIDNQHINDDDTYEPLVSMAELDSTNPPFLKLNLPVLRVKLIMQVSAMVRWFSLSPFLVYKAIQRLTLCHSLKTFAEEVMELVELTSIRDALTSRLVQEDSTKTGKVASAGMFFLNFPVYRFDLLSSAKDPSVAFFKKLDGFQACEINELKAGNHVFAVYG